MAPAMHDLKSNLLRSRIYFDLALLFHEPAPEGLQVLQSRRLRDNLAEYRSLNGGAHQMSDPSAAPIWNEVGSLDTMAEEYRGTFGHTLTQEYPPYETQYGSAHVFMQTQDLADISGFYKAFGLTTNREIRERLDHLSVQLEFMSFLACKQSHAECYGTAEQVQICRDAQKRFLEDHLGRWVPLFAAKLNQHAPKGFYHSLAPILKEFIAADSEGQGAHPSVLRSVDTQVRPLEFEQGAACDSETASCPFGSNVSKDEESQL